MLTRTEVLTLTGLTGKALSWYRELGLIPKPVIIRRGRGTQVLFPPEVVRVISGVQGLQKLGYSLRAIRDRFQDPDVYARVLEPTPEEKARAISPVLVPENESAGEGRVVPVSGIEVEVKRGERAWGLDRLYEAVEREIGKASQVHVVLRREGARVFAKVTAVRGVARQPLTRPAPRRVGTPRTIRRTKAAHRAREDTSSEGEDLPAVIPPNSSRAPTST